MSKPEWAQGACRAFCLAMQDSPDDEKQLLYDYLQDANAPPELQGDNVDCIIAFAIDDESTDYGEFKRLFNQRAVLRVTKTIVGPATYYHDIRKRKGKPNGKRYACQSIETIGAQSRAPLTEEDKQLRPWLKDNFDAAAYQRGIDEMRDALQEALRVAKLIAVIKSKFNQITVYTD